MFLSFLRLIFQQSRVTHTQSDHAAVGHVVATITPVMSQLINMADFVCVALVEPVDPYSG